MDQTDKRITAILESNARTSAASIGRQIGLSRTAVQDRITRLEADGAIVGYHAQLAVPDESFLRALLFVKIAIRPCEDALNWLASLQGVQEVVSLSGDIDAVVRCAVPHAGALGNLNDKIGRSKFITSSHSNVVLRLIR